MSEYAGHLYKPLEGMVYFLYPETDKARWAEPMKVAVANEHSIDLYRKGQPLTGDASDWQRLMIERSPVIAGDTWVHERAGLITRLDQAGFYISMVPDWDTAFDLVFNLDKRYGNELITPGKSALFSAEHIGTYHASGILK